MHAGGDDRSPLAGLSGVVCFYSVGFSFFVVLRHEIGWEERLAEITILCRVGRKTLTQVNQLPPCVRPGSVSK